MTKFIANNAYFVQIYSSLDIEKRRKYEKYWEVNFVSHVKCTQS